jgi:ribosomal-protein-alanine N-acetyltransferase
MATTGRKAWLEGQEGQEGASPEPPVRIRKARRADLSTVSGLEGELYSNPWHPDTFRALLRRKQASILVAEDPGDGVVGYAVFWWVKDQAELANLAVASEHQGAGVGGALLDRVLDDVAGLGVKTLFLEVRMSNESASRLYASRGFTQVSIRRGYYRNPREDARVLVRTLPLSTRKVEGDLS